MLDGHNRGDGELLANLNMAVGVLTGCKGTMVRTHTSGLISYLVLTGSILRTYHSEMHT